MKIRNLSIGKKIGGGFAVLLVTLSLTGGYAIVGMRTAATGARYVSNEYVPELEIAKKTAAAMTAAGLDARAFEYTGDRTALESARKSLYDAKTAMVEGETLAKQSSRLAGLEELFATAPELIAKYQSALTNAEKIQGELEKIEASNVTTGGDVTEEIDGLLNELKNAKMAARVSASSTNNAEDIAKTDDKINLLTQLRAKFFEIRLANYHAQVARDSKVLEDAMEAFKRIDETAAMITSLLTSAEDISEMTAARGKFKAYETQLHAQLTGWQTAAAVTETRHRAGAELEAIVASISDAAQSGTAKITQDSTARLTKSSLLLLAGVVGALVFGVSVSVYITALITRPLGGALSLVGKVAARNLTTKLKVTSSDELGKMTTALNEMVDGLSANIHSIAGYGQSLASASDELSTVSAQVRSYAEQTAAQVTVASSAAELVSSNIAIVATSAEEMNSCVSEIAKNAAQASKVALQAATMAEKTNITVVKLGESSTEVGKVVKVITSVAEQTNLLALNATIEAARAGEAGKGFAVVANEVKELAKQTAKATEDISGKIGAIQIDTKSAIAAIQDISGIIKEINDLQAMIASAVEEQAATTREISRNAQEASAGSAEIAKNIGSVNEAAKNTTQAAGQSAIASQELARLSSALQQVVDQFQVLPPTTSTTNASSNAVVARPLISNTDKSLRMAA